MRKPNIYIIVLNWNGCDDTVECIKSLKKIDYPYYTLVVVDNGSVDGSVKVLKSKFPKVKIIVNKENLGFSGGCNVGIKYALSKKAEYILLLNNDTTVDRKFLSELINVSLSDKKIGIVGPIIYNYYNREHLWFAGGKFDYLNGPFTHMSLSEISNDSKLQNKDVFFITGCCLLIKREVLLKVGYFDDTFFAYVEDVDLNTRARRFGYRTVLVPSSIIYHKISASSGGPSKSTFRDFYTSRNLIKYANKNLHGISKLIYFTVLFKSQLSKVIRYILTNKSKHALAIAKGTLAGLSGK